jgi:hypothetical protein
MKRLIGRLTCSQVIATVFALGWATCPMVFAAERGKQEGRRVTREIVSRVVGVEQAESLLSQMRSMNLGTLTIPTTTASDAMTLVRPEGTYVFNNLARDENGSISGAVTVYDANGAAIAEVNIARVALLDDNRIDFDISVSAPDATASESTSAGWSGSIAGLNNGTKGLGMAFIAPNGEESRAMLMNYGSLAVSGTPDSSLPLFSAIMSSPPGVMTVASNTADGESCEPAAVASLLAVVAICVAIVIVIIVVISCYAYCFPSVCC